MNPPPAEINTLHGAALRRVFDQACLARDLDPAWQFSRAMEGLYGKTPEELAEEQGPDWYYHLNEKHQGLVDVVLRQTVRGFELTELRLTGAGLDEILQHQLLIARELAEQMEALKPF